MARFDDPQFIIDQNLDPSLWHVVGQPAVGIDPNTGRPSTQPRSEQQEFTITLAGPGGQTKTVTMRPQGPGVNAANVGLNQLDWNVTKVEQGITPTDTGQTGGVTPQNANEKAHAETVAAEAQAAAAQQQLKDLQDENNKKQGNLTTRGLFMTDDQIAAMDKSLRDQGLQQQQIDAQLKIASDNNLNARTANEIAAVNAATSARVAASNAAIAESRLGLDGTVEADNRARDEATKELKIIDQAQTQQRIDIERLTAQQAAETAKAQVGATEEANRIRGTEAAETGRHNLATEAAATAQTEAAQGQVAGTAAGDLMRNTQQGATTASALLQQRAQLATGTLQSLLGNTLGNKNITSYAPDTAANLVQGLSGWTASLMGGQATLDSAARMVQMADPKSSLADPATQTAIGTLTQMLDRYRQMTGSPHPLEQQTLAAQQPNAPVAAPITRNNGAVQAVQPVQAVQAVGYTPPGYGAGAAPTYANPPWTGATPQMLPTQAANLAGAGVGGAFRSPATIVINAGGGG